MTDTGAASAERPGGATPAQAWVMQRIADTPAEPLTVAIVGPGGTGKTFFLDAVARQYEQAGVDVIRGSASRRIPPDRLSPTQAVLVDDAHRLEPAFLDELRGFAETQSARLVMTYRPWPRPSSLAALTASIASRRVVVMVSHLSQAAVASRIADRVGCRSPEAMAELVHEQSGGLPSLVDFVTQALQDSGRFDPRRPERFHRPDRITVSVALAERLRHRVDALEPAVHDLLEVMALGAALDSDVLGPLLGGAPHELDAAVEAARATGLLTESGTLIPIIRNLFLRLTPVLRSRDLQRRLAGIELDRGGSVLAAGRQLLGTGASGNRVAAVFETAAREAMDTSPPLAAELLAAAVEAGWPAHELASSRARAVALGGDLDQALRLADHVIADPHATGREQSVATAAAVLSHRGLSGRSVELYRTLPATTAVLAVPALIATGQLDEARAVVDAARAAPGEANTALDGAASLMARGMLDTVSGSAPAALSQLMRASALLEPVAATSLLPDTPAALTAVVAMQAGELSVADTALHRAVEAQHGGLPAQRRHRLLYAWVAMSRRLARPGATHARAQRSPGRAAGAAGRADRLSAGGGAREEAERRGWAGRGVGPGPGRVGTVPRRAPRVTPARRARGHRCPAR